MEGSDSSGTTASRRPFGMSTSTSGTSASRRATGCARRGIFDNAQRLDGFTWHCLRHTFASRLAMAGVDLLVIKELGGWKTLSMGSRYAHLAPGRLREGIERLVTGEPGLESSLEQVAPEVAPAGSVRSGVRGKYRKRWCPRGESNTRPRV
jgi:hypothetical protein